MSLHKIVLASNNAGKLVELGQLFEPLGISLIKQSDLAISEAAEPFFTFVENALAKARPPVDLTLTLACRRRHPRAISRS